MKLFVAQLETALRQVSETCRLGQAPGIPGTETPTCWGSHKLGEPLLYAARKMHALSRNSGYILFWKGFVKCFHTASDSWELKNKQTNNVA